MIFLDFVLDLYAVYVQSAFFENWFYAVFCILFVAYVPCLLRRFFCWG